MKTLMVQLMKFGIVGAACFTVDWGLLVFLTECVGVHYLLSGVFSFSVSVIVNYTLSRKFVFSMGKRTDTQKEFLAFVVLSVIGLFINEAVLFVLVEWIQFYYLFSKAVAAAIVMVYNFVTRKLLLETKVQG